MNHCDVARKITGLWQRQQCGYECSNRSRFHSRPASARACFDLRVRLEHREAGEALDLVDEAAVAGRPARRSRGRTARPCGSRRRRAPAPCARRPCRCRASRSRPARRPSRGRTAGGGSARCSNADPLAVATGSVERAAQVLRQLVGERLGDDHRAPVDQVRAIQRVRVERQRQVRRDRPRRGRPDQGRDRPARRARGRATPVQRRPRRSAGTPRRSTARCACSYSTSASASAVRQWMHQWTGFLPL